MPRTAATNTQSPARRLRVLTFSGPLKQAMSKNVEALAGSLSLIERNYPEGMERVERAIAKSLRRAIRENERQQLETFKELHEVTKELHDLKGVR